MTDRISKPGHPIDRPLIALDLMRGVAALMVLFSHLRGFSLVGFDALPSFQQTPTTAALFAVSRLGHEAVLVFFVLSGFLIGGPLLRRPGHFDPRLYAAGRVSRLMLPLVPACLFSAIVAVIVGQGGLPLAAMSGTMIGLNGWMTPTIDTNAPLWSLAYEIWFYVMAGAAAAMAAGRARLLSTALLLAGLIVFSVLDARYMLYWAAGAFAVFLVDRPHAGLLAMAGLAMAVIGCGIHQFGAPSHALVIAMPIGIAASEAILVGGIVLLLPWLSSEQANRLFRRVARPASWLAAMSYSLYLFHYPTNILLDPLLPRSGTIDDVWLGSFGIRLGASLAVAVVAYWCFERHTPQVRRWLIRMAERH